jgi:hypothetical protein
LEISEEIMISREKVRPKIVKLIGKTKAEAFEHPQNSSKWEEIRSSRGGVIADVRSVVGRSLDR